MYITMLLEFMTLLRESLENGFVSTFMGTTMYKYLCDSYLQRQD